jgi:hypothetical protein
LVDWFNHYKFDKILSGKKLCWFLDRIGFCPELTQLVAERILLSSVTVKASSHTLQIHPEDDNCNVSRNIG